MSNRVNVSPTIIASKAACDELRALAPRIAEYGRDLERIYYSPEAACVEPSELKMYLRIAQSAERFAESAVAIADSRDIYKVERALMEARGFAIG